MVICPSNASANVNGILEWIRERIIMSGTMSFISQIEDRIFSATFEQSVEKWNAGSSLFEPKNFTKLHGFAIIRSISRRPFSLTLLLVIFFLIHPLMGAFSLFGVLL